MCLSVSFVLVEGHKVCTWLEGLQGVWRVVQVCFEGCYVCENVGEGSVQPCLVTFFGEICGGVCKHDGRLLTQCERIHVGWWLCVSSVVRVAIRSLAMFLVPGHLE